MYSHGELVLQTIWRQITSYNCYLSCTFVLHVCMAPIFSLQSDNRKSKIVLLLPAIVRLIACWQAADIAIILEWYIQYPDWIDTIILLLTGWWFFLWGIYLDQLIYYLGYRFFFSRLSLQSISGYTIRTQREISI